MLVWIKLGKNIQVGNLRETFSLNQDSYQHKANFPDSYDFLVDQESLFEIGGKDKRFHSSESRKVYVAADDIEVGFGNKIPLWLFGFLY